MTEDHELGPEPAPWRIRRSRVSQAVSAGADEIVPFNRIRQRAAVALLRSNASTAQAWCSLAADYTAVEEVRSAHRAAFLADEGVALTYLPFVARAVIQAFDDFPHMNAIVAVDQPARPEAFLVRSDVNLGFAVDLDGEGLVVPVVHAAALLTVRSLARAVHDLAERARGGHLQPDDVTGVTFTITNPGAAGTWLSVPIIHQPAVAILSTDGVGRRVVADDGALGIRSIGHLGLSYDCRTVDPFYAAGFLARVGNVLVTADWMSELER